LGGISPTVAVDPLGRGLLSFSTLKLDRTRVLALANPR
jgi:hypothetical protein